MVLRECFFLGFGVFLVVPVSVALPSKEGIRLCTARTALEGATELQVPHNSKE